MANVGTISIGVVAIVLISGGLAACSTVSEVKQRSPEFVFNSQKNAKVVASCIADKMTDSHTHSMNIISTRLITDGYAIVHEQDAGGWGKTTAAYVAVTDAAGGGSETKASFAGDAYQSYSSQTKSLISGCL